MDKNKTGSLCNIIYNARCHIRSLNVKENIMKSTKENVGAHLLTWVRKTFSKTQLENQKPECKKRIKRLI